MNSIDLQKFHIPENEFVGHITRTLERIPPDGKAILFFMCRKLAKYSDDEERNVVIAYEAGNTDAKEVVLSWAGAYSSERLALPPLMVNYLFASMAEEAFNQLCEIPEEQIEDEDLRFAIKRYKIETAKEIAS
jgi:hypothetical protein